MRGSAYELEPPKYDRELVMVDRGTESGEFLRRYWHPLAIASQIRDLPVAVRLLGEDLILFRTPKGRFGLVYPRCSHRGTSLLYGSVEDRGIRCCHHGWLFSPDGCCLEQPSEPKGGKNLEVYAQPCYPVEEQYGLVFGYLGPLARKPPLPRFQIFEDLGAQFQIVAVPEEMTPIGPATLPCNWFQTWENTADPYHSCFLHKEQFSALMAAMPEVSYEYTPSGVCATAITTHGGKMMRATAELMLPNIAVIPECIASSLAQAPIVAWITPIDNTTNRVFVVVRVPRDLPPLTDGVEPCYLGGKTWAQLDFEGHQRHPTDYEAQVGQGPITFHSEEHLVGSDRGVSMIRKVFRRAVRAVQQGEDAPNAFEERIRIRASGEVTEAA